MKKRAPGAKRPLKVVSTLLLALASSSAMALGLGDIRVLSKPGQPLLAEIPIISADPSELENLRVALASPVTFARVGLDRPTGLVSELQFELTRNTQGRAVVRVSSQAPVTTPSLNFLIEADWGQGRLVREYSALVDAPESAVAVAEPEIVAPEGAMSNAIVREPEPAPTVAEPLAAEPQPAEAAPSRTTPVPPRNAAPASARAPAPAPAVAADGTITVRRGQTLSEIAGGLARERGLSRDQAMIALLRANPEAFIRGNVNLLKQGAVLRTADAASTTPVDAAEAAAMVREHTAQWRQARSAIPQPAATGVASTPASTPANAAGAATAAAPATAGGRLEIAPAVAATDHNAGTITGTAAGSEGDMLGNEQLQQAKEDVATRDAEIQELRGRVAELEKLQKQQEALISMKDSDLAAAQQRLADAPAAREGGGGGWYWLGLGVLLVVVAGWALARRRKPSPLPPLRRDGFDAAALAGAMPATGYVDELATQAQAEQEQADHDAELAYDSADYDSTADQVAAEVARREPAFTLEPQPGQGETAAAPALQDPDHVVVPAHAWDAAAQPSYRGVFEFPEEAAAPAAVPAPVEPSAAEPAAASEALGTPGRERLELAIAYLDLGDADTARALLQEVAAAGDIHSQIQARELLARLP
ncbi:FimV/HubP family polar landmark protein [Stenotrophomonas sp.]|uniref:FimV/HubP family polar landmark protein n=1 Tax=Stenotrophomonas sp. TaxID=69392 RepID=UPI00289D7017|nr:FimV/HubP family polar landmark protein [Stenotrophomonas sp.]